MKFASFMFLAVLEFITHSLAWVFGWWPFQIIDWIYLVFMIIGTCSKDIFEVMSPNLTPLYWFLNISTLVVNCWIFFGDHSTSESKFFGSVYFMCSLIVIIGISIYQIKNRFKSNN